MHFGILDVLATLLVLPAIIAGLVLFFVLRRAKRRRNAAGQEKPQ